ncbi:UNVERIFIED_CONTAM: hypothetical protein PYX00_005820 [Menopon gallinae]|uniref:Peroxisomal membrane protein PEX16 n=1 Tax=Menopon gallinae TaxID=328185 RepID=A0AAW2HUB5_9NEOP
MTVLSKAGGDFIEGYRTWLCRNPSKVQNLENIVNLLLFFASGRINNSIFLRECMNTLSKLFCLFNYQLMHSTGMPLLLTSNKIRVLLGILEYVEIVLEKSVQHLLGEKGRWTTITSLQLLKCIGKVTLVLRYKQKILCSPYAVDEVSSSENSSNNTANIVDNKNAIQLKRSGRVIRHIFSAPPINHRFWKPPALNGGACAHLEAINEEKVTQVIGELMYALKPVLQLGVMRKFGYRSWKSWSFSLIMDVVSLFLLNYSSQRADSCQRYTPRERGEIAKRRLLLLLYLIKSPYYERYSRKYIKLFSLLPHIGGAIDKCIDFYLSSYYFHWSR